MSNIDVTIIARHAIAWGSFTGGSTPPVDPGTITNEFWIKNAGATMGIQFGGFTSGTTPPVIVDTHDGDGKRYRKHVAEQDRKKKLHAKEFREYLERLFYGPIAEEVAEIVAPYETGEPAVGEVPALDWTWLYKDISSILAAIDRAAEANTLIAKRQADEDDDEETIMLLLQ